MPLTGWTSCADREAAALAAAEAARANGDDCRGDGGLVTATSEKTVDADCTTVFYDEHTPDMPPLPVGVNIMDTVRPDAIPLPPDPNDGGSKGGVWLCSTRAISSRAIVCSALLRDAVSVWERLCSQMTIVS